MNLGSQSSTSRIALPPLSAIELARLAAVPPEVEWFANLTNPNTRRAYRADVRAFMAFLDIDQPENLREVQRAHVLAWREAIRHLAPASVRRKIAAVSSLFEYLCDRNAVLGNPVAGVRRPKEGANEGKTPAISDAQARKLLAGPDTQKLEGKRDRAMLAVFLYHGPRRAELVGLRVGDLQERRGVLHWQFRGKGEKLRYIPAHPIAVAAVQDYVRSAGHADDRNGALFRPLPRHNRKTTEALSAHSAWRIVCTHAGRVGIAIEGFGPHSLRATAATNALEHGADIAAVSDWLGHANIATTRLYDKRMAKVENSPTFRVSY